MYNIGLMGDKANTLGIRTIKRGKILAVVDDLGATLYIGHKRLRYDDVRFFGRC